MPVVGVLALQGDVREHLASLRGVGAEALAIKSPKDRDRAEALVIPGGESTAIAHLLVTSGLRGPLGERLRSLVPVLGTCAGLILLAHRVLDGRDDQWSYDRLDVDVRRNGYGRQVSSFEAPLTVAGVGDVTGVFIRAPRIERVGDGVDVLASHDHGDGDHPVFVRQGVTWGCSFHPELTSDPRIHELFVQSL